MTKGIQTKPSQEEVQIEFLETLLNQVFYPILATDLEGTLLYWNRYAQEFLQQSAQECIGKNITNFLAFAGVRPSLNKILKSVRENGSWQGEIDGQSFTQNQPLLSGMEVKKLPLPFSEDGTFLCFNFYLATQKKVTKSFEKNQKNFPAQFNHFFRDNSPSTSNLISPKVNFLNSQLSDHYPAILLTLHPSGKILDINQWGAKRLGYTVKKLSGTSFLNLFAKEEQTALEKTFLTCLQQRLEVNNWQFPMHDATGNTLWMRQRVRTLQIDGEWLILMVCEEVDEFPNLPEKLPSAKPLINAFFPTAPAGFAIIDTQLQLVEFNEKFSQFCSASISQISGEKITNIFPIISPILAEIAPQIFTNHKSFLNVQISEDDLTNSGKNQHWNGSFFPILGNEKDLAYIGIILIENTEQKRIEAALRVSEERFRTTFEQAAVGIAHCSLDHHLMWTNQQFCEILGYTREELLTKTIEEITHPDDLSVGQECVRSLLANEVQSVTGEKRYIRKDGTPIWTQLTVSLARDLKTQPPYFMGVIQDITQHKLIEAELRQSEATNRALLEAIPDLILRLSKDGTYLDIKPGKDLHTIQPPEEIIGKKLSQVLSQDCTDLAMSYIQKALETRKTQIYEYQMPTDGEWQHYEVRIAVSNDDEVLAIIRDITEHKQTELALRQQTERERLLATMAQRIRRSLNLNEILNTTVEEVRQFLECDRVLIYRFYPDWSGVMVVESVAPEWESVLGTTVKDFCFAEKYIHSYEQGRMQVIEDIYTAGLQPCHINLLAQFQVRANLVLPILVRDCDASDPAQISDLKRPNCLWGLLIAHQCSEARTWQSSEIDWLQQLATQVGIAIQQSRLFAQVQQLNADLELQVEERTLQLQQALDFAAGIKRIADKVRDSLDESQILQTAVNELAGILNADYCCAALYNSDRTTATIGYEFTQPELGSALGEVIEMATTPHVYAALLSGENYQSSTAEDLQYPNLANHLAFKLFCPICDDRGAIGHLAIFNPVEYVLDKHEIHLVQQIANQCAIAIRQARLYQTAQTQVQELEKLNHLKDDFLSTVSHELRTPISNIKMAIRMLQTSPNQERHQRYLEILSTECEREIELINDLLDLQRLEAAAYTLALKAIDLPEWLPKLIEPFRSRVQNRQQLLDVDYPADLPPLISDTTCLGRILSELLNNACKYTANGGEITLRVRGLGWDEQSISQMEFTVCNQAEIPPAELPRIFEKFYRVPNADRWQQGGTGLGLALVNKLVVELGGNLQVESRDGWTMFVLTLPLEIAEILD